MADDHEHTRPRQARRRQLAGGAALVLAAVTAAVTVITTGPAGETRIVSAGGAVASTSTSTTTSAAPDVTVPATVTTSPVVPAPSTVPPGSAAAPATSVPRLLPRPTSIPRGSVPTLASVPVETTLAPPVVTLPTTSPLPVPELFDVRKGFGTPCPGRVPSGCFFFVYSTTATRGWGHHLYSDAPFRTEYTLSTDGNQCGNANPHHPDRQSCHWYIGPVQGRTAGQRECFWLTTVDGTRESEPSNRVCLTWTDGTA